MELADLLFFFVVVPMILIYFTRKRKLDEEMLASQKETIRLLSQILEALNRQS